MGFQGISIPGVGISVGSNSEVVRGLLQIGADLINSIVAEPQIQVYKREAEMAAMRMKERNWR